MSLIDLTKIYSGANLSGATGDVDYLPCFVAGTVKKIQVLTGAAQAADCVFSVTKNGVALGQTITVSAASRLGTLDLLNIATVDGDEYVFSLDSGNAASRIAFNLVIDDEVSGGGALPAGDLNAATNKLEKIQNRTIEIPSDIGGFSEPWDGTVTDNDKWLVREEGSSAIYTFPVDHWSQGGGKMQRVLPNGSSRIIFSAESFPFEDGKYITFEVGDLQYNNAVFIGLGRYLTSGVVTKKETARFRLASGGSVRADKTDTDGNFVSNSEIYNALMTEWRYLRLERSGANLLWKTSPDGIVYTTRLTDVNPLIFAADARIIIDSSNDTLGIYSITSNFGAIAFSDKDLLWWDATAQKIKPVTLAALKAAINALP